MSFASIRGAIKRALRVSSIGVLFAAFVVPPGLAGDLASFNPARFSPTLNAGDAKAFQFAKALQAVDAGTHADREFSHFHFEQAATQARMATAFEQAVKQRVIDPSQVARQLAKAKHASAFAMAAPSGKTVKNADAATKRIADAMAPTVALANDGQQPVVLAYANASPVEENKPLAAIASVAPLGQEMDEFTGLPESVPLPQARPNYKPQVVQEDEPDQQGERVVRERAAKSEKPARDIASVRPQNPDVNPDREDKSLGRSFRNLFGDGARAGNGVAVYDISAAKVYMPDGTVLRAHSGIGKMADNPKYTHVKMNGPTPAHTYNLRMRERRFHGVEAIRMLPVDGKNKFGRDGFLTHSMLLRGKPNQSHGCVAFADYNKFLKAFKQGKVKQMIVVPSNGAAVARRGGSDSDA